MLQVVFSEPVGGIAAGEPIVVSPENAGLLEQAARRGLRPIRQGQAWREGTTRYIHSGGKRGGRCPVKD